MNLVDIIRLGESEMDHSLILRANNNNLGFALRADLKLVLKSESLESVLKVLPWTMMDDARIK